MGLALLQQGEVQLGTFVDIGSCCFLPMFK
jgi:hypothetical protein